MNQTCSLKQDAIKLITYLFVGNLWIILFWNTT